MALDRAEVEHIAALARIGLTNQETETFREQLSHTLAQFEALRQLDTSSGIPTGHAAELEAVMRDDIPEDGLSPEEVLSNAPRRQGEFFRVNAVLEE